MVWNGFSKGFIVTFCFLAIATGVARAQGSYYDDWGDGYDTIYTENVGYGGGYGCGSAVVLAVYLNGNYVGASASYPYTATAYNSVSGTDGVDYAWDWAFQYQYSDPYSGNCDTGTFPVDALISHRTTNYKWTGFYGGNGFCEYDIWCSDNTHGTCGDSVGTTVYVEPDYTDFGPTGCSNWYSVASLAVKFGSSVACVPVGIGSMNYTQYACT